MPRSPSRRAVLCAAVLAVESACHRYEARRYTNSCASDPSPRAATWRAPAPEAPLAVVGTVTVAGSGDPVVGATVQLIGGGPSVRTDSAGAFRLAAPAPGTYRVVARQLGMRPGEDSAVVSLEAGQRLRLGLSYPPLDGCGMDMYVLERKPWWKWW